MLDPLDTDLCDAILYYFILYYLLLYRFKMFVFGGPLQPAQSCVEVMQALSEGASTRGL